VSAVGLPHQYEQQQNSVADNKAKCPAPAMFAVTEQQAAVIRTALEKRGEFSAMVKLRRMFPGITDSNQARQCVRIIAGWKALPGAQVRQIATVTKIALDARFDWFLEAASSEQRKMPQTRAPARSNSDSLMWRCPACGERNFNHYENCVLCGCARPAQAPTDTARPKPR
jgi:hypothetical protein